LCGDGLPLPHFLSLTAPPKCLKTPSSELPGLPRWPLRAASLLPRPWRNAGVDGRCKAANPLRLAGSIWSFWTPRGRTPPGWASTAGKWPPLSTSGQLRSSIELQLAEQLCNTMDQVISLYNCIKSEVTLFSTSTCFCIGLVGSHLPNCCSKVSVAPYVSNSYQSKELFQKYQGTILYTDAYIAWLRHHGIYNCQCIFLIRICKKEKKTIIKVVASCINTTWLLAFVGIFNLVIGRSFNRS